MSESNARESWSGRAGFVLVTMGATIGLGNLWRFPYVAGDNGGGTFVLMYLFAVFCIALPLFIGESVIGRMGRRSAPETMKRLAIEHGRSKRWAWVGWTGIVTSIIVLSFFSVIGGSSFFFLYKSMTGAFSATSPETAGQIFAQFMSEPGPMLLGHSVFAAATAAIVAVGIRGGIERAGRIMMPALLILLVGLAIYAAIVGDFAAAVRYLFTFDPAYFNGPTLLAALGQAFFTMSIGSAGIMTYSAYLSKPIPIARTAATVALGDTVVALLAGLAIFPIVFASGLDPGEGMGLVFLALPTAFAGMDAGGLVGVLFFVLFIFAAITSSIGLLEVIVARALESGRVSRPQAAVGIATLFWVIGIGCVLSFNIWSDFHPLGFIYLFEGQPIMGVFDTLVSNILLPFGALAVAVFAGWVLASDKVAIELGLDDPRMFRAWRFVVRYLAPLVILTLLIAGLLPGAGE